MTVETWIVAGGFVFGVLGFVLAVVEYRSKRRVEAMIRTSLMAMIQRTRTLVLGSESRQKLVKAAGTDKLKDFLTRTHRGTADLFVELVSLYLNHCRKFTYEDLERLAANRAIRTRWQEGVWRSLIAQRPENAKAPVPEWFFPPRAT